MDDKNELLKASYEYGDQASGLFDKANLQDAFLAGAEWQRKKDATIARGISLRDSSFGRSQTRAICSEEIAAAIEKQSDK